MTDKRDFRRGGYYWIDGYAYPSYSSIVEVLHKPRLEYWKRQQVYWAVAADPTIDMAEAMAAPYAVARKAARRGMTIHSLLAAGEKIDLRTVSPDYRPYATALRQWLKDFRPRINGHEVTLVHHDPDYACTADMPQVYLPSYEVTMLVEAKTGSAIYDEHWLQTIAQVMAAHENGMKTDGMGILLLKENGMPGWDCKLADSYDYLWRKFCAAWELWEWRNRDEWEKQKERAHAAWTKSRERNLTSR